MSTLNWRNGCTSLYESVWSVVHKLAHLNQASATDIKRALCEPRPGIRNFNWSGNCSLNTFGRIDVERLGAVVGVDLQQLQYAAVTPYLHDIGGLRDLLNKLPLRFCPKCICRGYHSPLHQLPWIAQCPLHGIPLVTTCPKCGADLSYTLTTQPLANSYGCHCGHLLWPSRNKYSWKAPLTDEEVEVFGAYPKWILTWEASEHGKYSHLGFAANNWDVSGPPSVRTRARVSARSRLPKYWNDILPSTALDCYIFYSCAGEAHAVAEAGHGVSIMGAAAILPCKTHSSQIVDSVEPFTAQQINRTLVSMRAVYKAVRRHLSRALVSHRRCIKEQKILSKQIPLHEYPVICPWAHALRFWSNYWKDMLWPEPRACWTGFYPVEGVINKLLEDKRLAGSSISDKQRFAFIHWVAMHEFAICLLNSFAEITHQSNKLYTHLRNGVGIQVDHHERSYFLIDMNMEGRSCVLHWWAKPVLSQSRDHAVASATHRARTVDLSVRCRDAYVQRLFDDAISLR